jgi:ketosteroid isomerase-like protein
MATVCTRLLMALIFLTSLSAHGASALAGGSHEAEASPEQAVRSFEAEVFSAYNQGDATLAAGHYASDAWVFIPDQPVARGREAIAANIARFMKDPNFKLGYTNETLSVAANNDKAYSRGKLQVSYTDPKTQAARTITSNYLLIMRKDSRVGWQVVEDISF